MKKFKFVAVAAAMLLAIFGFSLAPSASYAVSVCDQSNVPQEVKDANGCSGASAGDFSNVIVGIINGIVAVIAIVAAIFIVVGGVNYMTSQGDPGKTKKAKDTILYSLIGLIIAALAFAIVNFVVVEILKDDSGSSSNSNSSQTTNNTTNSTTNNTTNTTP